MASAKRPLRPRLLLYSVSASAPHRHFCTFFDRVGSSLEGEGSFLYFVYAPSSTDYATGVTLKTGSTSFDRKAINITGSLVIRNANTSDTLDISGQYPASVPTAFNSEPYNMAMEVNMTSWSRHNRPRA